VLEFIRNILPELKRRRQHRLYKEGTVVSRFIAKDIRREALVISAAEIDAGFITARIRTANLLYVAKGLVSASQFGPLERVAIDQLWVWTGASWGGLPDGTSIVTKLSQRTLGKSAD
jgi:hypothetical protein